MTKIQLLTKKDLKNLKPDVKEVIKIYAPWKDYDSDLINKMGYIAPKLMAQHLLPYVRKKDKLLEIGCGTGLNGPYYKNIKDCVITGIDISNKALELASKKRIYGRKVYSFLKQADVSKKLDFPDKSFDIVLCVGLFEYFKRIEFVIKEMARVSRRIVAFNVTITGVPGLNNPHSRREVMKSLKDNNLKLLDESRKHTWTENNSYGKKRIFTLQILAKK